MCHARQRRKYTHLVLLRFFLLFSIATALLRRAECRARLLQRDREPCWVPLAHLRRGHPRRPRRCPAVPTVSHNHLTLSLMYPFQEPPSHLYPKIPQVGLVQPRPQVHVAFKPTCIQDHLLPAQNISTMAIQARAVSMVSVLKRCEMTDIRCRSRVKSKSQGHLDGYVCIFHSSAVHFLISARFLFFPAFCSLYLG